MVVQMVKLEPMMVVQLVASMVVKKVVKTMAVH